MEAGTIDGFTNSSLLYSHNKELNKTCRYFSSRHYEEKTEYFYHLIAFKLAFVVIYLVNNI